MNGSQVDPKATPRRQKAPGQLPGAFSMRPLDDSGRDLPVR